MTQQVLVNSSGSSVAVEQKTQRIVVNPATSSISVISAGPIGPRGPAGPVGQGIKIEGSDTYSNIIVLSDPDVGDIWIQTDLAGGGQPGDGLLWDGSVWINVGPIRGPEGPAGLDSVVPGPVGPSEASTILTIDGQILTREAGVLVPITRVDLAADPAFTSQYGSGSIEVGPTAPSSPDDGDLWWDTDDPALQAGLVDPAALAANAAFITALSANATYNAVLNARYAPFSLGCVGVHTLTTAFTTSGTHTTFQADGLTLTRSETAGRRWKFTIVTNPYAPGGANSITYRLLRDGVVMRMWENTLEANSTTRATAKTFTHTEVIAVTHSNSVFTIQMAGVGNTQVGEFADANYIRQFIIEDIGI